MVMAPGTATQPGNIRTAVNEVVKVAGGGDKGVEIANKIMDVVKAALGNGQNALAQVATAIQGVPPVQGAQGIVGAIEQTIGGALPAQAQTQINQVAGVPIAAQNTSLAPVAGQEADVINRLVSRFGATPAAQVPQVTNQLAATQPAQGPGATLINLVGALFAAIANGL